MSINQQKKYWCLTCFWTGWLFRMNHGDHFELLILELMQQDFKILWPRPGCSIHEPWPPIFSHSTLCLRWQPMRGDGGWRGSSHVQWLFSPQTPVWNCFPAFRHDLQRSTRTFKARVQNVQSSIQNERSESDPKPTRMLPIQEWYDSPPMVISNPSEWPFDLDPQIHWAPSREGFPHHDNQVLLKSGPAQIAEWMKMEVGFPIQNCDLPRM